MLTLVHAAIALLATVSTAVLGLGLAGLASGWGLAAAGVLGLAAAAFVLGVAVRRSPDWRARLRAETPALGCGLALVLPLLPLLRLPVLREDDLIYHLAVPKRIFASGALAFDPYNLNSSFPMLFELPLVLFEASGGWLSPFLLNWICLLLLVWTLIGFAREHAGLALVPSLALAAAVALTPAVVDLTQSCYVELYLALLVLLSFHHYLRHLKGEGGHAWLLAVVFAGLAAATKYLGLFYLGSLVLWEGLRRRDAKSYYTGVLFAALLCAPWYLKNLWWTGNPVFPLLTEFFPSPHLSVDRYLRFQHLFDAYNQGRGPLDYMLLPWRLLRAADWSPAPGALGFGGKLSCLYALSILGLGFRDPGQRFLSCMLLGFFAVWVGISHQVRFLLPVLIPLLGFGAARALRFQPAGAVALSVWVALACVQSGWNDLDAARQRQTLAYLRGEIDREELMLHHLPDSWPAARRASELLDPARHRLMLIGNFGRSYYFDVPVLANTYHDTEVFGQAFDRRRPDPELAEGFLAREGITHLQINWRYVERTYADDRNFDMDAFQRFLATRTAPVTPEAPRSLRRLLPRA